MAEAHDTTELLHQLVTQLDRSDGPTQLDAVHMRSLMRLLATVVDALDQRLKALEERNGPTAPPQN